MPTYCDIAPGHPYHGPYHDKEYGFPIESESLLFERLTLEIFQAGLSWLIVLKKRPGLNVAFKKFDVEEVANFKQLDIDRLRQDVSIIRNKLKIEATIFNAKKIVSFRYSHGGFASWLEQKNPRSKDGWCKIFKQNFKFTGGEIVGEFLMSIGYLNSAHQKNCPVYESIKILRPNWLKDKI
jgi:DNA-3-methyladenine glycosylase I